MRVSVAADAGWYKNQFGPAIERNGAFRPGSFIAGAPARPPMAFWRRLEDHLLALQKDRPRLARYLAIAWWVSNAFLLLGFVFMLLIATGTWDP